MISRRCLVALLAAALVGSAACGAFDDPTPDNIIFQVRGPAGKQVEVIYATQFVAGVNEFGVTQVQVFSSDTVVHTLPVDTVINIQVPRQWFVHVLPVAESDTLNLDVIVDVDNRNLFKNDGNVFPGNPWIFVYMFNRRLTETIDVIL